MALIPIPTNVGPFAKPTDTFIKKIAKGLGGYLEPKQIIRKAKAEAEAAIILTQANIHINELQQRAARRFVEEQAFHQMNMESIADQAIHLLNDSATPDKMEDDWIANYFDKCRIISNAEMQELWARLLAGEANSPGAISRRTVNILSDLDVSDARLFVVFCGFTMDLGFKIPLFFNHTDTIFKRNGFNLNNLQRLESLGLIHINLSVNYALLDIGKQAIFTYFNSTLVLSLPMERGNTVQLGQVNLTQSGRELSNFCQTSPVEGFYEYVANHWQQYIL